MPWEEIKSTHDCHRDLPLAISAYRDGKNVGSIYKCDEPNCVKRFILSENQKDGFYWRELPGSSPTG